MIRHFCFLFALFLLFSAGTNLHLLSQETLPDTVWTKFQGMGPEIEIVKFSPDGKYLYAIAKDCENCKLKIDVLTGKIMDTLDAPCNQMSFSPTGDTIVFVGGKTITFIDYQTCKIIDTILIENYKGYAGLITSDGKNVIVCPQKNGTDIPQLLIYDIATKKLIKSFIGRYNYAFILNISPDGRYLSFNDFRGYDDAIVVIDLFTYEEKKIIQKSNDGFLNIGFTSDNKYLILQRNGSYVDFYETENFSIQKTIYLKKHFPNDQPGPGAKVITADSKFLVCRQFNEEHNFNTVFVWDIERDTIKYLYKNISGNISLDVSSEGYIASSGLVAYSGYHLSLLRPNWKLLSVNENHLYVETLYPNPTSNLVNIDFTLTSETKFTVELIDINGTTLETIPNIIYPVGLNTYQYNCSNLANGTYWIKISSTSFNKIYKFMKMD